LLTALDTVSAVSALTLLDATFFIESSSFRWMLEEEDLLLFVLLNPSPCPMHAAYRCSIEVTLLSEWVTSDLKTLSKKDVIRLKFEEFCDFELSWCTFSVTYVKASSTPQSNGPGLTPHPSTITLQQPDTNSCSCDGVLRSLSTRPSASPPLCLFNSPQTPLAPLACLQQQLHDYSAASRNEKQTASLQGPFMSILHPYAAPCTIGPLRSLILHTVHTFTASTTDVVQRIFAAVSKDERFDPQRVTTHTKEGSFPPPIPPHREDDKTSLHKRAILA
jgi:hypothetical protein